METVVLGGGELGDTGQGCQTTGRREQQGPHKRMEGPETESVQIPGVGGGQHSAPGPGVAPGSSLLAGSFSLTAQGLSPLSASPTSHIHGPGPWPGKMC